MALQASVQNVVVIWGVKSYRFLPYFSKYKKMTLVGSAALGHRVDQRERETLSITLSHFLFLLLALLTFPFLLGEKDIWRPSCQF